MIIALYYHTKTLISFLCKQWLNPKTKQLTNNKVTDLWSSRNFASMKNIRRKCNPIVDLSKFTFNKKILSEVVTLDYN